MSSLSKKRNRSDSKLNMNFAFQVAMEILKENPTVDGGPYQNMACSPLSISSALCVLVAGSKGPTRKQLLRLMEHNSVEEVSDMAFRLAEILNKDENDENAPEISYLYALWVAHPLIIKKKFRKLIRDVYKTQATTLDFSNQVDKVVNEVNLWADKQSKGLIKQIISRDCIDKDTAMIFTNSLYFKGVWVDTFKPKNTTDEDFYLLNGNKVRVPFMKMRNKSFDYGTIEGGKIIRMPYKGGKAKTSTFNMYIFLPEEKNGLPSLMQSIKLDANLFDNQIQLKWTFISELHIPKFEFDYSTSLHKTMKNFGLTRIFDKCYPDLIKMVHHRNDDEFLYVDKIHQKCRVEITEEGTEAAALTTFYTMKFGAYRVKAEDRVEFVANHPFMFMIREEYSGAILFIGTVLDPLSS